MSTVSRRVVITFVGNALAPLASLLTAPLLARGLGVQGRGEVAAAIAPLILGATIATIGLPTAVTYFVAKRPEVFRFVATRSASLLVATGLLTTGLIAVASPWLSQDSRFLQNLILLTGFAAAPTILVVLLQGAASGLNAWNRVLVERSISSLSRLACIVALFAAGHLTPTSAILVMVLTPLIGGVAYVGMTPGGRTGAGSSDGFTRVVTFGLRIWIGALSGILLARLDQALMAPLSSTRELGFYAVAVSLAELALVANNSIREVMFADLSTHFDRLRLTAASRISSLCAAAIALPLAIVTVLFLPFLFGEEFSPAIPIALVLIVAVLAGNPGSMAGVGLSALGRPGQRSRNLVIACVVNCSLVLVLVPAWGAMGAAIATLGGNLVSSNLNIAALWRLQGISPWEFYRIRMEDVAFLGRAGHGLFRRAMK